MNYITLKRLLSSVILACMFVVPTARADVCGCDVTKNVRAVYDSMLKDVDVIAAKARHAPWGLPRVEHENAAARVLVQRYWITGYDPELRMPTWTLHRLERDDFLLSRPRTECFRSDPRLDVESGSAMCRTYRGSGMDRGHMVPSADMTRSEPAMVNTYVLSNMAPQYPRFNRQLWRALEIKVRHMVKKYGTIYVMTGAIFDRDGDGVRDADADALRATPSSGTLTAAIATHFYKVVVVPTGDGVIVQAWLLKHANGWDGDIDDALRAGETTIDVIEAVSGLDINPFLGAGAETAAR